MNQDINALDIEKLLADLQSKDASVRKKAAKSLREQKVTDERIIASLNAIASREPNNSIRKEAIATLTSMGIEPPPMDPELAKNRKQFRLGIFLFIGLNILLFVFTAAVQFALSNNSVNLPAYISTMLLLINVFLPYVINIGLLIFFAATKRGQIALGMLAGFGIALAIVILLGLIFTVACFVLLSGYNS
jgi:hypothetical protein